MNYPSKFLVVGAVVVGVVALSGSMPSAQAGPMGPSAQMAARLKKYPTSSWLAHYLPDDRYKIAGGVWKYVSTDLDTYYHRPNSPLMLRQSAGRVIGFSSTKEAEEAGYMPGPGVGQGGAALVLPGGMKMAPGRDDGMRQAMSAIAELRILGMQMQGDKNGNLPLLKQRLQRVLVLLDAIPVTSRDRAAAVQMKSGIRGLVKAVDLASQGD